jgi:hypothetical protein
VAESGESSSAVDIWWEPGVTYETADEVAWAATRTIYEPGQSHADWLASRA